MADTLIFLDIKPIPGDSTINGFEGKIELESATLGLSAKHTQKAGQTKATPDLKLERLSFTKFYDKASPNLSKYMATRKVLNDVVLHYVDLQIEAGGAKAVPVLKVTLKGECYIEDISIQANDAGKSIAVKETVQISFRKLELSYYPISDVLGDGLTQRKEGAKTFTCEAKDDNT